MSLQQVKTIIKESDNIVFLGGAGVSTESGIPDFRSASGLYETGTIGQFAPEEILSHQFFMNHPLEFYQYYLKYIVHTEAAPNMAHRALAELERAGKLKAVITQNIDGLHQQAGSQNVLELHGSIHRNYCMACARFHPLDAIIEQQGQVPRCACGGIIKPDVVLYQEGLDDEVLRKSIQHIAEADVFIIGGTSLKVYPAAGLLHYYNGDKLILMNKTPTPYDSKANYVIQDSIGKVMQSLLA